MNRFSLSNTTIDFLIDRSERATIYGVLEVSRDTVKAANYTETHGQVVVGAEGQTLIKSSQEARVSNQAFCKHYAAARFTGQFKRVLSGNMFIYMSVNVPDQSLGLCLKGKATAMGEQFMNEHADVSGQVRRTFENVNVACENGATARPNEGYVGTCLAKFSNFTGPEYEHWAVTGTVKEAMHVSGAGQPDHDEVNTHQFTCSVSMIDPIGWGRGKDARPDTKVAGKASDSVTCEQ